MRTLHTVIMQDAFDAADAFSKLGGLGATGEGVERLIPANWARTLYYTAQRHHAPETVEEVQAIVAQSERVRVVGARHSFSACADTPEGDMITLELLPVSIEIDDERRTVAVSAHASCAELSSHLHERGWALHTLPSIAHVTVAGALATATHGSGDASGSLLCALEEVEYINHEGELVCCCGGLPSACLGRTVDLEMQGVVLGGFGVLIEVTLAIEPSFDVQTDVYLNVPWHRLLELHSINQVLPVGTR